MWPGSGRTIKGGLAEISAGDSTVTASVIPATAIVLRPLMAWMSVSGTPDFSYCSGDLSSKFWKCELRPEEPTQRVSRRRIPSRQGPAAHGGNWQPRGTQWAPVVPYEGGMCLFRIDGTKIWSFPHLDACCLVHSQPDLVHHRFRSLGRHFWKLGRQPFRYRVLGPEVAAQRAETVMDPGRVAM